ncbi:gp436 family protein [Hoeflea sp.]|uniref:gp436 family protein n=1 Tax=Hoeflea sp. TaxID=1940281 RepID=UPI003A8DDB6F
MYATVADMTARFGETQMIRLSRPEDRTAETVDEVKINTALNDATAVIDGYVRGRYLVPIATPPKEIVRAACILARYDLAQGEATDPSEEMAKSRKDVISWLENIAKELIHLDVPPAAPEGAAVGSGPRMSDRERIMSLGSLRGF